MKGWSIRVRSRCSRIQTILDMLCFVHDSLPESMLLSCCFRCHHALGMPLTSDAINFSDVMRCHRMSSEASIIIKPPIMLLPFYLIGLCNTYLYHDKASLCYFCDCTCFYTFCCRVLIESQTSAVESMRFLLFFINSNYKNMFCQNLTRNVGFMI